MELTKESLYNALQDLNEALKLGLALREIDACSEEYLKAEISDIAGDDFLDEEDILQQMTVDVLLAMEFDVPAGIKIMKNEKVDEEQDSTKNEATPQPEKQNVEETPENKPESIPADTPKPKKGCGKGDHTKPGVINTMIEFVKQAGRPVSKDELLEVLKKQFPDRNPDGMKRTIGILAIRAQSKGINITKDKEGFLFQK